MREKVEKIGSPGSKIRVGSGNKNELLLRLESMTPYSDDFLAKVEKEALRIGRFGDQQRDLIKIKEQESFLRQLRTEPATDLKSLDVNLQKALKKLAAWCRLKSTIVCTSDKPSDNVLRRCFEEGLPPALRESAPHFNWARASLPLDNLEATEIPTRDELRRGIRGNRSRELQQVVEWVIPVMAKSGHRAVVCMAGFPEGAIPEAEQEFLERAARHMCLPYLQHLHVLQLAKREKQWEDTASLIAHQVRGSLNPITTETDIIAKHLAGEPIWSKDRAVEAINTIRDESDVLSRSATETLHFWRVIMGAEAKLFSSPQQNLWVNSPGSGSRPNV